jgi:hypothetical protein
MTTKLVLKKRIASMEKDLEKVKRSMADLCLEKRKLNRAFSVGDIDHHEALL